MRLINNTKSTSRIGTVVKIDPRDPKSFILADTTDTKVLGIVAESVEYRKPCEVITYGAAKVFVQGNVRRGDTIRYRKSTDGISAGNCAVAKTGDAPYLQIGTALESGRGLVNCELNFSYISSGEIQSSIVTITSSSYSVGASDSLIICNSTSAIAITLPSATGTGRVIQIANINTGLVTVSGGTINGETSQEIYEDNCMDVRDYGSNTWVII
jgi:hypothetical protein